MTEMPAMKREQLEAMLCWLDGKAHAAEENKLKKPPGDLGWWPMRNADKYEREAMEEIGCYLQNLQLLYPTPDGGIAPEGTAQIPAKIAWRLRDNERARAKSRAEYQEGYFAEHSALRQIAETLGKVLEHPFILPELTPEELVETAVQSVYVFFRPHKDDETLSKLVEDMRDEAAALWLVAQPE